MGRTRRRHRGLMLTMALALMAGLVAIPTLAQAKTIDFSFTFEHLSLIHI